MQSGVLPNQLCSTLKKSASPRLHCCLPPLIDSPSSPPSIIDPDLYSPFATFSTASGTAATFLSLPLSSASFAASLASTRLFGTLLIVIALFLLGFLIVVRVCVLIAHLLFEHGDLVLEGGEEDGGGG